VKVNQVKLLPVKSLRPNPENPKKPFDLRGFKGLMTSLEVFGFAGVCIVAPDPDGAYTVLDGNTRYEELVANGVPEVPCVVMEELTTRAARRKFFNAYDRHKKLFDEEKVMEQLRELAEQGENARLLADLTGLASVNDLYRQAESREGHEALKEVGGESGSLLIVGPAEEIAAIRGLLNHMRQKMTASRKVMATLTQAAMVWDWEDEKLLGVLLATIARFRGFPQEDQ